MAGKKKNQEAQTEVVTAFKGFDNNLACRGFQYEVGKTYVHEGDVETCSAGFHACEFPFDVLNYYPPSGRFAVVEMSGSFSRASDKIASGQITIKAELTLPDFIKRGVEYILSKVDFADAKESNAGDRSAATNTGDRSAATNTGYQSAATNTGDQSAATNTGDRSAATNTGDRSAATNTGDQSAATNTGDRSAAEVSGKSSIAIASGREGKAKAAAGCAIVLCEYNDNGDMIHVFAAIAGCGEIKPDTYYTLQNGKPVEA